MNSFEETRRLLHEEYDRLLDLVAKQPSEADTIRNWLTAQEGRLRASIRRIEADDRLESNYRELVRLREVQYDLDALQRVLGMIGPS